MKKNITQITLSIALLSALFTQVANARMDISAPSKECPACDSLDPSDIRQKIESLYDSGSTLTVAELPDLSAGVATCSDGRQNFYLTLGIAKAKKSVGPFESEQVRFTFMIYTFKSHNDTSYPWTSERPSVLGKQYSTYENAMEYKRLLGTFDFDKLSGSCEETSESLKIVHSSDLEAPQMEIHLRKLPAGSLSKYVFEMNASSPYIPTPWNAVCVFDAESK